MHSVKNKARYFYHFYFGGCWDSITGVLKAKLKKRNIWTESDDLAASAGIKGTSSKYMRHDAFELPVGTLHCNWLAACLNLPLVIP